MASRIAKLFLLSGALLLCCGLLIWVYLDFVRRLQPHFENIRWYQNHEAPVPSSLPLTLPERHITVTVEGGLTTGVGDNKVFLFSADDCIDLVKINGRRYEGAEIPFCDPYQSKQLDLSEYLTEGVNTFEAQVTNTGGPGSFGIEISPTVPLVRGSRILLSVLIGIMALLFSRAVRPLEVSPCFETALRCAWNVLSSPAFLLFVFLVLSVTFRLLLIPHENADLGSFLYQWIDFINANGKWRAFAFRFSDYTPLYLYLLTAASYLTPWVSKAFAIKSVSILGDFVLGLAVFRLVGARRGRTAALGAFFLTLSAPTVWMNSTLWGQCDNLYTLCLIYGIFLFCRRRPWAGAVLFGAALSFKAQAMFLIPVLVIMAWQGALPSAALLIPPAVFLASILPAWFVGRPLADLLLTYFQQSKSYGWLSAGAANFYAWLPDSVYSLFYPAALLLCLMVLVTVFFVFTRKRAELNTERLVALAAFISVLVPFCLPKMHERYFFTADVFFIVFAFYFPRFFWTPVVMQIISGSAYMPFLLGQNIIDARYRAFGTLAVLIAAGWQNWALWFAGGSEKDAPEE